MKSGTKQVLKVLISIVYIVWGLFSPISAFQAVLALDVGAIAAAAVGVMMLLAGIFCIAGTKKSTCRIFGVVIFICSVLAVVLALPALSWRAIVTAVLAWLFIACL